MKHRSWSCPKCGHDEFETGDMRVSEGNFARFFNLQNKRYFSLTCENCCYTEFYKGHSSTAGKVLDFITG